MAYDNPELREGRGLLDRIKPAASKNRANTGKNIRLHLDEGLRKLPINRRRSDVQAQTKPRWIHHGKDRRWKAVPNLRRRISG